MARPTLFLIDGSSQMYRAYHAFRGRGLSNQEGQTTHAVYVFVTMLRKLLLDHAPPYIAASFDLAGPTFRDEIVADYKANRAAMPDDLAEQIAWVHEACEAMGVPILTARGFEADDVIGTVARRAASGGYDVGIVSIDKDFFQLVDDRAHIRVYDPREDGAWFDEAAVVQKFGVAPAQVVDVLALVGDTSDNVAGVPGIGKKGAIELIDRFGSLEALGRPARQSCARCPHWIKIALVRPARRQVAAENGQVGRSTRHSTASFRCRKIDREARRMHGQITGRPAIEPTVRRLRSYGARSGIHFLPAPQGVVSREMLLAPVGGSRCTAHRF
jgi:5'-3' exonuclease